MGLSRIRASEVENFRKFDFLAAMMIFDLNDLLFYDSSIFNLNIGTLVLGPQICVNSSPISLDSK